MMERKCHIWILVGGGELYTVGGCKEKRTTLHNLCCFLAYACVLSNQLSYSGSHVGSVR
jgi:hypothetical protein